MNCPDKQTLIQCCRELLETRIAHAQTAMRNAQESANQEDKSSAGDKYETARAMGQLDRDMNARQLQEALNTLAALNKIQPIHSHKISVGSLIKTSEGWYMLAVGIGMVHCEGFSVTMISPQSPLAQFMMQKAKGDAFEFRNKKMVIEEVY